MVIKVNQLYLTVALLIPVLRLHMLHSDSRLHGSFNKERSVCGEFPVTNHLAVAPGYYVHHPRSSNER